MGHKLGKVLVGLGIATVSLAATSGMNVGMSILAHSEKVTAANGRTYMRNTYEPRCRYRTVLGVRTNRGVGEGESMYCRWLAPAVLLTAGVDPT
jgi:hypothetical protein